MAINSKDPLLPALQSLYPEDAVVVFQDQEPTTEAIARDIFEFVASVLRDGFQQDHYSIKPGLIQVERVRVWETPSSWAEYGA